MYISPFVCGLLLGLLGGNLALGIVGAILSAREKKQDDN